MVALPAITAGSDTGCTNRPSCPGCPWSTSACHHSAKGSFTLRPPRRAMAASFVSGAVSGTSAVQGTPRRRAQNATPWAMLPALAV